MKYKRTTHHKTIARLFAALVGTTTGFHGLRAQDAASAVDTAAVSATSSNALVGFPDDLKEKIKYIFVLYPENRSFDGLYGSIPSVNGLAEAKPENYTQTTQTGTALASLPQPTTSGIPGMSSGPDARFPSSLPNQPYDLLPYVPFTNMQGDMIHRFYTEQYQINDPNGRYRLNPANAGGAAMSKFTAWSDNPGLVLSHYDAQNLGEGLLGKQYTICDNNFHTAFGGSFLNAQFLISARAPVWPATPTTPDAAAPPATGTNVTTFDANGYPAVLPSGSVSDGFLTADGDLPPFTMSNANQSLNPGDYWTVNTIRPLRGPAGGFSTADTSAAGATSNTPVTSRLPLQYHDTIGDRLTAAGVTWAWYSGGWNNAKAGKADFLFQFHHQAFAFFAKYALATTPVPQTATTAAIPGTDSPGSAKYLKDEDADFYPALTDPDIKQNLPQVIFVKPIGENNQHPGYAAVQAGEDWIAQAVAKIQASKVYKHSVIFITYDEHGGMWDHVKPPRVDDWGPGSRVPLEVVSPFVKRGFIDHTQYETSSLLAFIEKIHGLAPLNEHDANATPPTAPFVGQPDLIVRGQAGVALNYTLPAYGEPEPAKLAGDLDGLTYDKTTGLLSGTPTAAGSYSIKVKTTDDDGAKAKYTMRLDVLKARPEFKAAPHEPVAVR